MKLFITTRFRWEHYLSVRLIMRGCIANCEVMKEEILVILILQHGSTIMLKYSVVTWKWVKV